MGIWHTFVTYREEQINKLRN